MSVSDRNSTTTPLAGAATWTGGWEDCSESGSISIIGSSDVIGTLHADFSIDGVTQDRTVRLSDGLTTDFGIHGLIPVARYVRARVVNGAGAQSTLRVQTILHSEPRLSMPTSRVNSSLDRYSDVIPVRAANDVQLDTAIGNIGGRESVRKFGTNTDVGTGAQEDVWAPGGAYNFLTTAATMRIKLGGNAADDAAGLGAQEVTIYGLDENWDEASEAIATAGASQSSPTTTTFIRVNRVVVTAVGTYGGDNEADIDIETSGGTLVACVAAGQGRSLSAVSSVPAGHTAYIERIHIQVDSGKTCSVYLYERTQADVTAGAMGARELIWDFIDAPGGEFEERWDAFEEIPEKSDFWFAAQANTSAAAVSCQADYVLVHNTTA